MGEVSKESHIFQVVNGDKEGRGRGPNAHVPNAALKILFVNKDVYSLYFSPRLVIVKY